MKADAVIAALGALAHQHRLGVFRLLVERGPEGLPAGTIAERLSLAPSSLSFHLQALQRAGLVRQRRASRQLIYSASFEAMNGLLAYLTRNCCGRDESACGPACAPSPKSNTASARKRAQRSHPRGNR